jgi:hypothetical protein
MTPGRRARRLGGRSTKQAGQPLELRCRFGVVTAGFGFLQCAQFPRHLGSLVPMRNCCDLLPLVGVVAKDRFAGLFLSGPFVPSFRGLSGHLCPDRHQTTTPGPPHHGP